MSALEPQKTLEGLTSRLREDVHANAVDEMLWYRYVSCLALYSNVLTLSLGTNMLVAKTCLLFPILIALAVRLRSVVLIAGGSLSTRSWIPQSLNVK